MLSTHKLHHAVVLAEHGNFHRAANALNLTQPALSRSIQSLEEALGVRLFDRGHKEINPTALGQLVVERAKDVLVGIAELEREIEFAKGLQMGTLAIDFGPYPAGPPGQRALARFVSEYPDIHCRVRVTGFAEVANDVALGHCDIGIADLDEASAHGLVTELLVHRQGFFLARRDHPIVRRRRCTVDDLLRYPWATIRFPARMAEVLPKDLGHAGHWDPVTGEFVPALEVDQVSALYDIAIASDILIGTSLSMAENELRRGKLAVVPFFEPRFGFRYGFISRPNRTLSPATLRFMDIVREIEAEFETREVALRKRYLKQPAGPKARRFKVGGEGISRR